MAELMASGEVTPTPSNSGPLNYAGCHDGGSLTGRKGRVVGRIDRRIATAQAEVTLVATSQDLD